MNEKDLNSLDGDSVYQEVLSDKIEKDRKSYKQAIKNAVVRNDQAQKSAKKALARAEKNQTALTDLVDGGMEGFLAKDEDEDCDEEEDDFGDDVIRRPKYARKLKTYKDCRTGSF